MNDASIELGKASGVLSHELDALIDGLNERQQNQVRKLLVRLVDFLANTSLHTRRRMPLHELRPTAVEAQNDIDAILDTLVAKRLAVWSGDRRNDVGLGSVEGVLARPGRDGRLPVHLPSIPRGGGGALGEWRFFVGHSRIGADAPYGLGHRRAPTEPRFQALQKTLADPRL
jgi:hypothetical protein